MKYKSMRYKSCALRRQDALNNLLTITLDHFYPYKIKGKSAKDSKTKTVLKARHIATYIAYVLKYNDLDVAEAYYNDRRRRFIEKSLIYVETFDHLIREDIDDIIIKFKQTTF